MVRNSLNYVGWNKRKEVVADLRQVCSEATLAEAEIALLDFEQQCNEVYLSIAILPRQLASHHSVHRLIF
jgi:putative transposase